MGSNIKITSNNKISKLLETYTFLLDALIKFDPKLKRFKNPILRKTVGKRATLLDVSSLINVNLGELLNTIKASIELNTRDTVVLDEQGKSGWISTRDRRKDILKSIVLELHEGDEDMDTLQKRFKEELGDIDASEIADMEQDLINAGELTAEQITKLCDLHINIFNDALEIKPSPHTVSGHPLHTYLAENRAAEKLITDLQTKFDPAKLIALSDIITHYTRLENQLFPVLEKVGFSGPTQVMWAIHDDVRDLFKQRDMEKLETLLTTITDMISKEENILFPTSMEKLTELQWVAVRDGEEEIGFSFGITPGDEWTPTTPEIIHGVTTPTLTLTPETPVGMPQILNMKTGKLLLEQINAILTTLPLDLSFINTKDEVAYYSDGERIFPRSPGVIGRSVFNCHPPKSQHIVRRILDEFKQGTKDVAEFWINLGETFVHIRYFAVRDKAGKYMGTLEMSQNIAPIRSLEGERRLLDWDKA
ncbi:MAG: DUF438 domain-containing protein [Promethearchaeota archaeon]